MDIAPSILSLDFAKFKEQLTILNSRVKYIHFDVMDGHFVPNISFGPDILKTFKNNSDRYMDVHLMILNPQFYAKTFIDSGANGITFHIEALNYDIEKCIEFINFLHANHVQAGISIKPATNIETIEPLLKYLDLVLVMSVEPGFGGQLFMESSLEKVKYLKKYRDSNFLNYKIEIDGGINDTNALICKEAGVDIIVAGSYVFKGNISNNIDKLEEIIK